MKRHDMAKFGFLFLKEGQWEGEQIITSDWVTASTREQISTPGGSGYGYQWWIPNEGVYMAAGYAGQYIFVLPEFELVVIFTGNFSESDQDRPEILLEHFIIPAAKSSKRLSANPSGVEMLESMIQQAALPREEPEPVLPLPEIAHKVTGKTYVLDSNPLGLKSVSFIFQGETEALISLTFNLDEAQGIVTDPNYLGQVEWHVGLDNVYRFTPGEHGIPMGLKGGWETEQAFVVHIDNIGNTGRNRVQFTFEGDRITIQIWEGGMSLAKINGRLDE
jgi:hypothetical protein